MSKIGGKFSECFIDDFRSVLKTFQASRSSSNDFKLKEEFFP